MDLRDLPVDELVLDPNLNLRDRLDAETVERYADSWGRMPPVTVFEVEGRWLLADGFHRHAAAVQLHRRTIAAEVRGGTLGDALDFAAGANLAHGLPLSRGERRRAVEVKLRRHHERSDRHLADDLGVGRELVAKVRRQLVEAGQIPSGLTRVGADGKAYPAALPKDPNERRPRDFAGSGRDDPRDRGGRESDPAPWDDATDPLPPGENGARRGRGEAPWEVGAAEAKAIAKAPPVAVAAPTIDEMLELMAAQVREVLAWTDAEGFAEGYRRAGVRARDLFQTAVADLAERADRLRQG